MNNPIALAALALLLAFATLGLCEEAAPAAKTTEVAKNDDKSETKILAEQEPGFLYLAAQDAIHNNQPQLAISFLQALIAKDNQSLEPQITLADLYLQTNQSKPALELIGTLLANKGLPEESRSRLLLMQARAKVAERDYLGALAVADQIIGQHPDSYNAHLLKIQLLNETGDPAGALSHIKRILPTWDTPELRQLMAQIYLGQGKTTEAMTALQAMQQLAPDDMRPVLLQADILIRQKKGSEAEKIMRDFLVDFPQAFEVSNRLGRLLIDQKRFPEAIALYRDLGEKIDNPPEVAMALGLLYMQIKDFNHASEQFAEVAAKSPDNMDVQFYLALSLEAAGKQAEAQKIYDRFKKDDNIYHDAQLRLASIELQQDRFDAALKRTQQVLAEKPDLVAALELLSAIRLSRKEYALLISETEQATAAEQASLRLLFNRAAALEELHRYDESEHLMRRVLARDPESAEALNFLGYLLAEMNKNLDEAEQLVRKALIARPNDPYFLDSLAWVYYQRGDYAKALPLQQQSKGQIHDDPVITEHLGDIHWRLGKKEEARALWRESLKLNHNHPELIKQKIEKGL